LRASRSGARSDLPSAAGVTPPRSYGGWRGWVADRCGERATNLQMMAFPQTRMRRLRASASLRGLVRETQLSPARLVRPLFIAESGPAREPIAALPGVARHSLAAVAEEAAAAHSLGIAAVMLFGVPAEKDEQGSSAWDPEGVVQLAVAAIKRSAPQLLVITDVCLCEYTAHGHCG